jgi:hypothetical protein
MSGALSSFCQMKGCSTPDWLGILALTGQQKLGAIAPGQGDAVGMAEGSAERFDVGGDGDSLSPAEHGRATLCLQTCEH